MVENERVMFEEPVVEQNTKLKESNKILAGRVEALAKTKKHLREQLDQKEEGIHRVEGKLLNIADCLKVRWFCGRIYRMLRKVIAEVGALCLLACGIPDTIVVDPVEVQVADIHINAPTCTVNQQDNGCVEIACPDGTKELLCL